MNVIGSTLSFPLRFFSKLRMKISIFIKSYPGDYDWLHYCLRSIHKYVTGHSEVVVVLPTGQGLPLTKERIVYEDDWNLPRRHGAPSPGYYHQMYVKLCADLHCPDADYIFIVDSDCVFKRPFDLAEMFGDGKPKLLRRPWLEAAEGIMWRRPAELALGFIAEYDTMACHPFIYRREDITRVRKHIETVHRQHLADYVKGCQRFIEFVTIGNYILHFLPDKYQIIDYGSGDAYPRPLLQHWSWGGLNPQTRAELEKLVS